MNQEWEQLIGELREIGKGVDGISTLTFQQLDDLPPSSRNSYPEQEEIVSNIYALLYEITHCFDFEYTIYQCEEILEYIYFRHKVIQYDINLINAIREPEIVTMDIQRRVKSELGLSNRETLDFIAMIRGL